LRGVAYRQRQLAAGGEGGTGGRGDRRERRDREEGELASSILLVVHEEELDLLDVADPELVETVRHQEARLGVGPVANLDVLGRALEMATEASIHTVGLAPGLLLRGSRESALLCIIRKRLPHFSPPQQNCSPLRAQIIRVDTAPSRRYVGASVHL